MAELSVEEITRLARNFLVGKGGPGELEDLKRSMQTDPQLPLELLQQMQTALDEVPPAGFSPDQWAEIDTRVASMVNPMLRSGLGGIGRFFARLFGKKRAPEGTGRLKRRGDAPEPEPLAAPAPTVDDLLPSVADESMEEMAPIAAPVAASADVVGAGVSAGPMDEEAAPKKKRSSAPALKMLGLLLLVLALCYGLYLGALKGLTAWKNRKPAPVATVVPAPVPAPKPTPYTGPPRRSQPSVDQNEPLPSDLPPQTPQAAGSYQKIEGLEAKDKDGNRGFPLP